MPWVPCGGKSRELTRQIEGLEDAPDRGLIHDRGEEAESAGAPVKELYSPQARPSREALCRLLERHHGNVAAAALGKDRQQLYR